MTDERLMLVLAGNREQFEAWCLDNNRSPRDPNVVYVQSGRDVDGRRDFDWTTYGTWYERRDGYDLQRAIESRIGATRDG